MNRGKNMKNSYTELLKKQIKDLENQIENSFEKREELRFELNKLKLAEFEEDMREETSQQLLKG